MSLSTSAQPRYAYVEQLIVDDFLAPARVVELGAAPGDQIAQLARRGYLCTSVDIGESADEWGSGESGRMTRLLDESGVDAVIWNLEQVPYPLPDDSFDVVIMTEVYEHLRDYPARSLVEARRILRSGGRLYFTTPNQAYVLNRLRLLTGRNVQTPLEDWVGGLPFARHVREYTFSEVEALMQHAGLRVVRLESRHFHVEAGRRGLGRIGKRALDWVAQQRKTLGPQIIAVAECP